MGSRVFHGVMVSILDSDSSDPSSNLGRTFLGKNTFYSPNRTCLLAPATPSGLVLKDTVDRCGTDPGRPHPGAQRPRQCRPLVGSPGCLE